jgi:exo-beta-1,3-glucanase (GH17 family)
MVKKYSSLLHQQIAAARAALVKISPEYKTMPLTIGESGWPTDGHAEATVQNACEYASHLIANAHSADLPLDPYLRTIYYFEAFDEQGKAAAGHGGIGMAEENNFGLCYESGAEKCKSIPVCFS